jgi:hypothetical protein
MRFKATLTRPSPSNRAGRGGRQSTDPRRVRERGPRGRCLAPGLRERGVDPREARVPPGPLRSRTGSEGLPDALALSARRKADRRRRRSAADPGANRTTPLSSLRRRRSLPRADVRGRALRHPLGARSILRRRPAAGLRLREGGRAWSAALRWLGGRRPRASAARVASVRAHASPRAMRACLVEAR